MDKEEAKNSNTSDNSEEVDREDIYEIHQAALRERVLPGEGNERGPWWLYAIIFITFAFGFFYIGYYFGDFSYQPHQLYISNAEAEVPAEPVELTQVELGESIYGRVCSTCHQANGEGVEGAFPTLVGTDYVNGNVGRFAGIIIHGLYGEIEVNGVTYNGNMPAWGEQISDEEVAAVMTYVRNSFGNDGGDVPVDSIKSYNDIYGNRTSQWEVGELNDTFIN
ncbi:c-type cytochrome [Gracilimonas sp.]|uniref:c-type cytochrome n=1 Tax=Gracilimonas sp. TaxID=1974203 RepID=UPI002871C26D|nr:cytochrome c [Gracilimonas sp.]